MCVECGGRYWLRRWMADLRNEGGGVKGVGKEGRYIAGRELCDDKPWQSPRS